MVTDGYHIFLCLVGVRHPSIENNLREAALAGFRCGCVGLSNDGSQGCRGMV